jgi:hypothetical protein
MLEEPHRSRTTHDHPDTALVAEVGNGEDRTVGVAGTHVWAALQTVTRCLMVDLDATGAYVVRVLTGRRGAAWEESVDDVVLTGSGRSPAPFSG